MTLKSYLVYGQCENRPNTLNKLSGPTNIGPDSLREKRDISVICKHLPGLALTQTGSRRKDMTMTMSRGDLLLVPLPLPRAHPAAIG